MRNKIEDLLSRVAALEADFATLPVDVDEQRRRHQLIRYVTLPLLGLGIDLLQAISRTSRGNCGLSIRDQDCSDLLTTFKMMKMYSGFSKICGRLSLSTGSVHHLGAVLDADGENRWYNKWRTMNKDAKW